MSDEPRQALPYERPAAPAVPRWQFRLLFVLVLVNLGVTLQTAYVPTVTRDVRQWWAERQERRRVQALYRQARDSTEPATKVAWEEDPDAAAKLLAGGAAYRPVMLPTSVASNYPFLAGWPPGAGAAPPQAFTQLVRKEPVSAAGHVPRAEDTGFVFMHGLKSPRGQERLVYVLAEGQTTLGLSRIPVAPGRYSHPPPEPFESTVVKSLTLGAVPCLPTDGTSPPRILADDSTALTVHPRGGPDWKVPWRWVPADAGKPGQVVLERRDRFRFYAGQPDPKDPSSFTVDYELDGVRGRIRGRLRDNGRVSWEPEAGATTGSYWDPYAPTARTGR